MEVLDWTITVTLAPLVLGLLAFYFTVLTADKCFINAVRGTEEQAKTSIVPKLASEVSPACSKNCLLGCLDVLEVLSGSSRKLNLWLFRHIRNRCYDQGFSRKFQHKDVFLQTENVKNAASENKL